MGICYCGYVCVRVLLFLFRFGIGSVYFWIIFISSVAILFCYRLAKCGNEKLSCKKWSGWKWTCCCCCCCCILVVTAILVNVFSVLDYFSAVCSCLCSWWACYFRINWLPKPNCAIILVVLCHTNISLRQNSESVFY